MNLEDELRSALERRPPSPDFTQRVLAQALAPARRAPRTWVRWAAALAASVILAAGGFEYRQYQGERAKNEVLLAVRITAAKLYKVQKRIQRLNAAHRSDS
jgi:uncharacterized protein HemX